MIGEPTNARSRRTRAALLDSAREILEGDGFEAPTMTAVAERAAVTRRTAYLHFGSRSQLVGALFDHVAAAEDLDGSLRAVWAAPDAGAALTEWAAHLARYHPRLLAFERALDRVRAGDPDAADHRRRISRAQLAHCRRLARRLHADRVLAPGWTVSSATDMLYALVSTDMIEALIRDRRWSRSRLADQLGLLLRSTFLAP